MIQQPYFLTEQAKKYLRAIRQYTLRKWGKAQSTHYLHNVKKTLNLLASHPYLGKRTNDIHQHAYSFPHQSHVIYYLSQTNLIIIFAVLHKNMTPTKYLLSKKMGTG